MLLLAMTVGGCVKKKNRWKAGTWKQNRPSAFPQAFSSQTTSLEDMVFEGGIWDVLKDGEAQVME